MGGNNNDIKTGLQFKLGLSKVKLRLKLHSLDLKSSIPPSHFIEVDGERQADRDRAPISLVQNPEL